MPMSLQELGLRFNPFEPAASGTPVAGGLALPAELEAQTTARLDELETGGRVRALVLVGAYGSGKTTLLQWLHRRVFPCRQVKSFLFDGPGVQFYDLANALLRSVGRKEFAKFVWELAGSHVNRPEQASLFESGFERYLRSAGRTRAQRSHLARSLQDAIVAAEVTPEEQIANCLARIVTDFKQRPYFEYRDFLPRQKGSVVAEREEARYFRALLRLISTGTGAKAVAFLIDEFEEISLQKRLTRRAAHDYLATLRRLINLAEGGTEDLWLVLSMTPDAEAKTKELEPSLGERILGGRIELPSLGRAEALALIRSRIATARDQDGPLRTSESHPFPEQLHFQPATYENPRRLVQACFRAVARASRSTELPFTERYLQGVEEQPYASGAAEGPER